MASRKPSAKARLVAEFRSQLGGMDDAFAAEREREEALDARREEARRERACTSKNRYATRAEAQDAIGSCARRGVTGLVSYRCPYCGGWHLTSHPRKG